MCCFLLPQTIDCYWLLQWSNPVSIGCHSDQTSFQSSSLYLWALGKHCFVKMSSSTLCCTVFLYKVFGIGPSSKVAMKHLPDIATMPGLFWPAKLPPGHSRRLLSCLLHNPWGMMRTTPHSRCSGWWWQPHRRPCCWRWLEQPLPDTKKSPTKDPRGAVANAIDFYLMAQLGIDSCWRFRLQKSWTDSYTLPSAHRRWVSCKIKTNDAVSGGWQRPALASVGGSFDQRKSLLTTPPQIRAEVRYSMVKPIQYTTGVYKRLCEPPSPACHKYGCGVSPLQRAKERRGRTSQLPSWDGRDSAMRLSMSTIDSRIDQKNMYIVAGAYFWLFLTFLIVLILKKHDLAVAHLTVTLWMICDSRSHSLLLMLYMYNWFFNRGDIS